MVGGLIKPSSPQVGESVGEGNVGWQADITASQATINPNSFSLCKITLIVGQANLSALTLVSKYIICPSGRVQTARLLVSGLALLIRAA